MTAIDASVSELSSSLVRRPLSLLPPSPSTDFSLFASSSSGATVPAELIPSAAETSLQLGCYDAAPSEVTGRQLATIDISRSSSASSSSSNNWLADLSVEVCKVEAVEEGSNSGGGGSGGAGDWDESVFFEAAAAAAACCATGQSGHHHHHQHDAGNLDVLLGNPNLHHSSGSDLLELDVQSCCTVDFPLSPKQLLGSGNSRSSSSSSSSSNSNSSCAEDGQLASAGLSSPPSTPSPASSSSGRQLQQQPLPQPPQPCSMCSKVFTSTSALAKHKLTHSDERRFSCQLCGKAFKRQDHLNGHLITHREKKPFECRADGCGKSYCDARSLRRHQDNHHAPPGSTLTTQPASPSTGLGSLPSRSSSALSNAAGLFASELNGGSPEIGMPSSSVASSFPEPSSNSSTASSSGHFANQAADQQFAGWDSVSNVVQLDSCIQYAPSASTNGYLTTCSADNQDAQSVAWPSAPAESVSPKSGKKPTAGLKAGQNKVNAGASKIPAAMPAVKSTKKTKVKVQHIQNGKAANGKNGNSNKKMATDSSVGANNDGLTTQQLELIQEIMRQTQEQHRLMQEEQQQHIQHNKPAQPTHSSGPATAKPKKSNSKVKWTAPAPAAPAAATIAADPVSSSAATNSGADGTAAAAANGGVSGRPVECNVCQRRFKNTPALNGHMRLHGGFLKKDAECSGSSGSANGSGGGSGGGGGGGSGKKPGESKKDPNTPPLLTASVSVRALIEEKIIQRRNNMAANNQSIGPSTTTTCSTVSSTSSVVVVQDQQPHALPVHRPEASVMMMDVLDDEQRETINQVSESQPLIPKLEPEGYFEGSLLALSPVSLHRALEGDMDVNDDDPGSNEAVGASGLHNLHHHGENFFSTSSSSSSALSDVPLLDDSVFHQVSAAAASALLSDIGSLDLQSYMEGGSGGSHQQQHGQSGGQYTDLSQYLASSGDAGNGSGYPHETSNFQQQHSDGYVYHQHESAAGLGAGFNFDPSPSTPLSSLCSPQHYVQQYHHSTHQPDYHSSNSVDTSSGGYQSMLMPTVPSPYTPSPSPVSPAVAATLPHMQRFQPQQQQQQQQQDAVGFYSTSSFSVHNQSNFMIDCANSVLYNMESGGGGGGWDHAAELTAVATEAIPQLMEQEQAADHVDHSSAVLKPARIKKSRPSRAKKVTPLDESVDVKRRRNMGTKKFNYGKRDELDEMLMWARGNGGQYASAMNATAHHCVMLNPKRNGAGLYWNLVRDKQVMAPQVSQFSQTASTSRQKSRVRVGKDHQCAALPRCKKKEANKEKETAVLCWSGNGPSNEEQVGRLLAWSRSASLPGPKRSEEQVLAVLTHFHGDVQAAKLHLLTQRADAQQDNNWTPEEMTIFHAALLQHGKDFPQVAQHLPSKTASQCVQFYYLWKKVCRPQEYASIKRSHVVGAVGTAASQSSPSLADEASLCDWRDVGCEGDLISLTQPPAVSQDCSTSSSPPSSMLLLSSCEFADCPAISTNGATPRRYQANQSNASAPTVADKLYPCSVCHKVFDKVKSRSAHMKTHKSAASTIANGQDSSSALGNKNRKNHHLHHKSPLGALTPASPVSSTSHSSLSSTSCSLPSPFLPSQSLF